jgi:hypothetical protein
LTASGGAILMQTASRFEEMLCFPAECTCLMTYELTTS